MSGANVDPAGNLARRLSKKADKYWAKRRTDLSLLKRCPNATDDDVYAAREELEFIKHVHDSAIAEHPDDSSGFLDLSILDYPTTLAQFGLSDGLTLQERKEALEIPSIVTERTKEENLFLKDMANKAVSVRKSNWAWRIGQHAQEMHEKGWYPFFVTLTLDPKLFPVYKDIPEVGPPEIRYHEPADLWKKGREFRLYIRNLADMVCREMGHPLCRHKPYNPESDYVTYAGVIEHGKSREHHHGHFIIWLRCIPPDWRICPNAAIRNRNFRTRNECVQMRTFWKWSDGHLSPAMYFRSVGDIWYKKHNFVLPVDKSGNSMRISIPRIAGLYVTKYLQKEHKEWHHRMKTTRNLGMTKLKELLQSLDDSQVQALTWRSKNSNTNHLIMTIHSCPLGLIRSLAKQENFYREYISNRLDSKALLRTNCAPFIQMLRSAKNGARPDRMDSFQFFDWVAQFLQDQKGYSKKRLLAAHKKIAEVFPKRTPKQEHKLFGANKNGHSSSL